MIEAAIIIGEYGDHIEGDLKDGVNMLFSGGFLSTVFWVSYCAYINHASIELTRYFISLRQPHNHHFPLTDIHIIII